MIFACVADRTAADCAHPHGSQARLVQLINMHVGPANTAAFCAFERRFGAF
jgi:hypothetical protein